MRTLLRTTALVPILLLPPLAAGDDVELFCFGDGVDAHCPCENGGGAGAGCANVTGAGARLTVSGQPDLEHDTLALHVEGLPAQVPGVFFSGDAAISPAAFGNGLRCVGGGVRRLQVVFSDAAGRAQSTLALGAADGLHEGDVRCYQFWYRDIIGPCAAAYNSSSACRVQW